MFEFFRCCVIQHIHQRLSLLRIQAGGFASIDGFMGVKNDDTHAGMFAALPEIRLRNQSLTLVDLRRA
ncbi:MAG: hypothetical protein CO065_03825 [Comamonadaceae bacterium CG_4_9_14_0_8_um_filter_57_21]|nr:MAG: hypothetical protein CO065_03825 [Comamonadaceae bacterium CG_4_9_14_0_8_um_filter_57_21]